MVDLIVGPDQESFRVHKAILCARAAYFQTMFDGNFKEAQELRATLPEDDPHTVGLFIEWAYAGRVATNEPISDQILLYGFAEKLCLDELADHVMTNIMSMIARRRELSPSRSRLTSDGANVKLAYDITAPHSYLRAFMARLFFFEMVGREATQQMLKEQGAALGSCVDLATTIATLVNSHSLKLLGCPYMPVRSPVDLSPCEFHHHSTDRTCPFSAKTIYETS
jgi:hypothetical protein